MIARLIAGPLILVALVLGGLYTAYGEVDPCRALAVEQSRTSEKNIGGQVLGPLVESLDRAGTAQMSEAKCARRLVHAWWHRLKSAFD